MLWASVGLLVVQIVVATVSYLTIHRHRAIYGIKTAVLRMPRGTRDDIHALETEHIDNQLRGGRYTILQIVERFADKDLEIIFGQIKN